MARVFSMRLATPPAAYVRLDDVTNSINNLVLQRYILREDGDEIIRHAKNSDVPTLADIPSDIPDDLK